MSTEQCQDRLVIAKSFDATMDLLDQMFPNTITDHVASFPPPNAVVQLILQDQTFKPYEYSVPKPPQTYHYTTQKVQEREHDTVKRIHVPTTGPTRTLKATEFQRVGYELRQAAHKIGANFLLNLRGMEGHDESDESDEEQPAAATSVIPSKPSPTLERRGSVAVRRRGMLGQTVQAQTTAVGFSIQESTGRQGIIQELVGLTHLDPQTLHRICSEFRKHSGKSRTIDRITFERVFSYVGMHLGTTDRV